MIVLNVIYKCKPCLRDEFLEMIISEGIDTDSRADKGNIKYDYYIPADGSDDLLLIEKWSDADAFAEHGKQPQYARLGKLKAQYVNDTIIEIFETKD
ncbi:MAG: antibiotic biosynthesis monooxygenase [Oscillospiraceae bacterium]|nr:antibiotic biosynthesis monooxygenase [Oscillospiraceae bacterium]